MSDDDVESGHKGKEFLRDLGKRNECYLKIVVNSNNGGIGCATVVDDVGCPVANVRSFNLRQDVGGSPVLTLEIAPVSAQIITK